MNEELRSADFYESGSALRHLATIKELFATHLALLWMATKHTRGSLASKKANARELERLELIIKTVKSLVNCEHMMNEIKNIASDEDNSNNAVTKYSVAELQKIFDTFESDTKGADDTAKLNRLQQVYFIIHEHFAEKAGNRGFIYELAEYENEYLFKKESKILGSLNVSMEKQKKGSFLPEISPNKGRKDFIENAAGDDHDHEMGNDDTSQHSLIQEDAFANSDIDRDFAYLRYHL